MNDLKFAFRQLLKNPGFTAVAVLTLALGIGANTAIFSILNATLFPELPFPNSDRLVRIHRTTPFSRAWENSQADFLDYHDQARSFDGLAAITWSGFNFSGPRQSTERITAVTGTADLLGVLGFQPALGRTYTAEEDQAGRNNVAILSHRFWIRLFDGDSNVIGATIWLDGEETTVIGVMPKAAECAPLIGCVDLWRPLAMTQLERTDRGNHFLHVVGRLNSGVSLAQAQGELNAIARRLARDYPTHNAGAGVRLLALGDSLQPDMETRSAWFLLGVTAFVLLIACANLTNLQLARVTGRAREFAVRGALGASRWRLIRQLLAESLLISFLGGALALIFATWCIDMVSRLFAPDLLTPLDARVICFTIACCFVSLLAFGTLPAWLASIVDPIRQLKENVRGAMGSRSQHRLQRALIIGEVALALMLLTAAGASIHLLHRFVRLDPGWSVNGLLTARVAFAKSRYHSHQRRAALFAQLEERLNAIPGVGSASLSSELPIFSFVHTGHVLIENRPWPRPGEAPLAYCPTGGPDYFKTLGIALRQGRVFTRQDAHDGRAVAIINETMARKFWPSESPLGKRISIANPDEPQWREIVGVVNDVRFPGNPLGPDTLLQVYRPLSQDEVSTGGMIALRTKSSPDSVRAAFRQVLADLDSDLPVYGMDTVPQILGQSRKGSNLVAGLLAAFGALGLLLAAVGIYGVTSYFIAQRTNEFGIRMALGAQKNDVLGMVMGQGLRLGAGGALLGLAGAFVLMRLLDSLIPSGSPMRDPAAIAGVPAAGWVVAIATAVGLVVVSLLACYLPARSAAKIDPMEALRHE